jgi:CubicO group peptidase (beta-lactamase class C family)
MMGEQCPYKEVKHGFDPFIRFIMVIFLCAVFFLKSNLALARTSGLYFPPMKGKWETVSLGDIGWKAAKLKLAMEFAGEQNSSGVVILYRGRILAEQYWKLKSAEAGRSPYKNMLVETTSDGRAIEDVASVQKSVISFLAAIAREQGKLDLDRTVANYIGNGWSKASPKQEEKITVRHLMTMTSGLNETLNYMHPAGTVWEYNTKAYSRMVPVLTKVTNMDINQLTHKWLTAPAGMGESRWELRRWIRNPPAANTIGFATSARDLARFGLLVLAEGKWNGRKILKNSNYLLEALEPSQNLKPSYGLLWWLVNRSWFPEAPDKAIAALGRLSRIVFIVPNQQLVFIRIGDKTNLKTRNFLRKFCNLISAAMPD